MDTSIKYYIETFPQYRATLEFLQSMLNFQAELAQKIKPGQPKLKRSRAIEQWDSKKPLFSGETMYPIDPVLFQEALTTLRPLLSSDKATQEALDRLLASTAMSPPNIKALLNELDTMGEPRIQHLADDLAITSDALVFLLQTVLSPFLEKASQPYRKWIEIAQWRGGICPVCGSEPVMARLTREEGRRILTCSLCRTEWTFDRLRCPFCESEKESPKLNNYFTVDDDKVHRVDCCDQCHRYLKTVDERKVDYPINVWAENIITAHMDTLAIEQGYR